MPPPYYRRHTYKTLNIWRHIEKEIYGVEAKKKASIHALCVKKKQSNEYEKGIKNTM